MQSYRILKNQETKLVIIGEILSASGLLRSSAGQYFVIGEKCKELGLDPKTVAKAQRPFECMAKLGENLGGVRVISEEDYQAEQKAKRPPESQCSIEYRAAQALSDEAETIRENGGVSSYFSAKKKAAYALAQWAKKYPVESTAQREAAIAAWKAQQEEIKSRPGYNAALEGRD